MSFFLPQYILDDNKNKKLIRNAKPYVHFKNYAVNYSPKVVVLSAHLYIMDKLK